MNDPISTFQRRRKERKKQPEKQEPTQVARMEKELPPLKSSTKKETANNQSIENLNHPIALSISQQTISKIEHALESLHQVGDYRFSAPSDVVRWALLEHLNGKTKGVEFAKEGTGTKKRVTFLVRESDFQKYQELLGPISRKKSVFVERIVCSLLTKLGNK